MPFAGKAQPPGFRRGGGGIDFAALPRRYYGPGQSGEPRGIDVYDSVLMSSIIPLSEKSIAAGSAPIECPDFTRGKWKTKKPAFGVEG